MRTRSDGRRTRERIIRAGARVFAERGFQGATHDAISKEARANKALISHHFGGKGTLYRAVWRNLLDSAAREHPVSGGLPEGATEEERLEAHVGSLLTRHYGDGAFRLLERLRDLEKVRPTGLVDDIRRAHHDAHRGQMLDVLKGLLGKKAPRSAIGFYEKSVLALCRAGWPRTRLPDASGATRRSMSARKIGALSRQITRFVLAGIEAKVHEADRPARIQEDSHV
jgi:AcrR family transcriptional regulator